MTVESHRVPTALSGGDYDQMNLYYFAVFISSSTSWEIIDSWTETIYIVSPSENGILGRYKGDPIADLQWLLPADILDGGGIVIQQKNPRSGYPAMQVCIQAGDTGSFACVSGHSYRADEGHGTYPSIRGTIFRVGTQADWDLDDARPDFQTKASDTYYHAFNNMGGPTTRMYFSADDDWILFIQSNDVTKDFTNVLWFGQYNSKTPGQDTIEQPAYGILCDNNGGILSSDGGDLANDQFLGEHPVNKQLFGALDESGVWRDWSFMVNPGCEHFLRDATQPNEFDATVGIDLFEVVVRGRGTFTGHDDRLIGSLRGVYAAMRLGNGAPFDGSQYMCLGGGYGVVVEWDGSTVV